MISQDFVNFNIVAKITLKFVCTIWWYVFVITLASSSWYDFQTYPNFHNRYIKSLTDPCVLATLSELWFHSVVEQCRECWTVWTKSYLSFTMYINLCVSLTGSSSWEDWPLLDREGQPGSPAPSIHVSGSQTWMGVVQWVCADNQELHPHSYWHQGGVVSNVKVFCVWNLGSWSWLWLATDNRFSFMKSGISTNSCQTGSFSVKKKKKKISKLQVGLFRKITKSHLFCNNLILSFSGQSHTYS